MQTEAIFEAYHEQPRSEVAELVPDSAKNIVDVGCGAGVLGAHLKLRAGVAVRGVEPFPSAAARARKRLDDVFEGEFFDELPASWPQPDCIVFADVLEHMVDPWAAVARARDMLAKDGCIVASIPNVRHTTVLRSIWRGRWDYQDCGLLDRTHLRFFARENAIELFERAGMEVEIVRRNVDAIEPWTQTPPGRRLRTLLMKPGGGARFPSVVGLAADALTLQFLIRAKVRR